MLGRGLWAEPRGAYAILVLLVLAVLGAALAPGGLRNRARRSRRLLAGAVLVGAALSLLWPQLERGSALDIQPGTPGDSGVTGLWADGGDTLAFDAAGSYRCRGAFCLGVGHEGTWRLERDGSLVARWSDGHEVPWRVVTYHGRPRLALLPLSSDGSGYEGRLVFRRVE